MKKIKISYPKHLYDASDRKSLFDLLKSKDRNDRYENLIDKKLQDRITWVENEYEADIFVLPHDWNAYFRQKKSKDALLFCFEANKSNKIVLSYIGGDLGATIAVPNNTIIYRPSGYRSKLKPYERTIPFFIHDPISTVLAISEERLFISQKRSLPIVGFCGMAPSNYSIVFEEIARVIGRNLKSLFKVWHYDKQEVLSCSNLRVKAMKPFRHSTKFKTNYIIRTIDRGGSLKWEKPKSFASEYFENQLDSDLMICARGIGNYSIRFYETLAMGRIPVFIDTDSPLPDIGSKDWKDYIVWIDKKDVKRASELTDSWLLEKNIQSQKRLNRQLWIDYFRFDNYWLRELDWVMDKSKKMNC